MKNLFFLAVAIGGALAVVGYFGWKLLVSVSHYLHDRRQNRLTRRAAEQLRAQKEEQNAGRLDNGCEHRFGQRLGGFPPFACRLCGLEQERPAGPCDHVWRIDTESAPGAVCEKCGKKYKPIPSEQRF